MDVGGIRVEICNCSALFSATNNAHFPVSSKSFGLHGRTLIRPLHCPSSRSNSEAGELGALGDLAVNTNGN